MTTITHTVTEKHVNKRLDIFIAHYEPRISRNRIQTLIRDGLALVNGKTGKPGYKVKLGERKRIWGQTDLGPGLEISVFRLRELWGRSYSGYR